jgi:hypothetical protein
MHSKSYRKPLPRLGVQTGNPTAVLPNKKLETYKLVFDLLKHLTTLSAGSILLLITLFEKVFKLTPPGYQLLFAFGGFLLSIACSVLAMIMLAFNASDGGLEGRDISVFSWAAALGWAFFAVGILSTLRAYSSRDKN